MYRHLDPSRKEFRLFAIQAGYASKPLRGTLRHAFIDDMQCPQYETISYCWGDASNERVICINDTEILVPKNTFMAIRRAQHVDKDRLVWIDAVCINQQDLEERSHQVAIMKDVYANSIGNLVLLGNASSTTPAALDSLQVIVRDIADHTNNFKTLGTKLSDGYGTELCLSTLPWRVKVDGLALVHFYELPWFQ